MLCHELREGTPVQTGASDGTEAKKKQHQHEIASCPTGAAAGGAYAGDDAM